MNVTVELRYGPHKDTHVTQENMQRTIDALERARDGKPLSGMDGVLLTDAISIFKSMQRQLPREFRAPKPVINLPRTAMPNFTRAGNCQCATCGRDYRDHQAFRYTDDPEHDMGLVLFRLCDGREVKL